MPPPSSGGQVQGEEAEVHVALKQYCIIRLPQNKTKPEC